LLPCGWVKAFYKGLRETKRGASVPFPMLGCAWRTLTGKLRTNTRRKGKTLVVFSGLIVFSQGRGRGKRSGTVAQHEFIMKKKKSV